MKTGKVICIKIPLLGFYPTSRSSDRPITTLAEAIKESVCEKLDKKYEKKDTFNFQVNGSQ